MNTSKRSYIFCCILMIFFSSCVRKPRRPLMRGKPRLTNNSYLYLRNGRPFGILRMECSDCQMTYIVNSERFTIDIKEGNEDRFIYPKQNSFLRTELRSNGNQMIRVLAINPNGKMVSNVLDSFVIDQHSKNKYPMRYNRFKNTIVVDISKKKH